MFDNGRLRAKLFGGQGVSCRENNYYSSDFSDNKKIICRYGRAFVIRRRLYIFAIAFLLLLICFAGRERITVGAETGEEETSLNVGELIDNLDLSGLDEYLDKMSNESSSIVGLGVGAYIKALASGEKDFSVNDIINVFLSSLSTSGSIIPMISSLLAICIIWSLVSGVEFKNNSISAKKAVNLACLSIMSVIVLYWIYSSIAVAGKYLDDLKELCDAAFPVFFTLLASSGANGSASALSPVAAIISVTLFGLIKTIVFPIAIAMLALSVTGSISDDIPLNSLHDFLQSIATWLMKTGFYVFSAFMGAQGIFSGIKDGVSLRMGKFALSKYVPLIGGYLSDGFNYVIAGSIIIKNAAGITVLVLIFIRFIPVLISLIMLSLSLKLVASVAEPLNVSSAVRMLKKAESGISVVRAAVTGTTFLTIIFVGAVMLCGSSVI